MKKNLLQSYRGFQRHSLFYAAAPLSPLVSDAAPQISASI